MVTSAETLVTVIDACGKAGVPVLIEGEPGIGKSALMRDLAAAEGVPCETVIASLSEPSDFAGLPVITPDGVTLEPPRWAKRLYEAQGGYVFFDELLNAPHSVQSALLRVVHEKVVGELELPASVRVVAAQNPVEQSAGGYGLTPPLANRFCHLHYRPSVEDWLAGMANDWAHTPASRAVAASLESRVAANTAVTGFIHHSPALLSAYPTNADYAGGPWPSRRTWDMLGRALAHLRSDDTAAIKETAFGLVGEGAGIEFLQWREAADLPDPVAVTKDPSIVDWAHERQDRVWAVLNGVVTLAGQRGTAEAFRAAWGPLGAADEAGVTDMAAAAARTLARQRPVNTKLPAVMRRFATVLAEAGLLATGTDTAAVGGDAEAVA